MGHAAVCDKISKYSTLKGELEGMGYAVQMYALAFGAVGTIPECLQKQLQSITTDEQSRIKLLTKVRDAIVRSNIGIYDERWPRYGQG